MTQVRDGDSNNIAPGFALPNGVDITDSLNENENTGFMMASVFSHTNSAITSTVVNRGETISNIGDTAMSREIAAIVRFPTPVPLTVSYPKNWGTQDLGLMKQFLNEAYSLYVDDDKFNSSDAGKLYKSAIQTGEDAILRKVQNLSGASASGGFLNVNQTELLFQGIDFRELNISHSFAPTTEKELMENLKIVNIFKKYSAPKIAPGLKMIYPKLFELDFGIARAGNIENIFKTKLCACTNIQVDYTPDQLWNVFKNGHPVKFNMDLSFKEVELLTEDDFDPDSPFTSH